MIEAPFGFLAFIFLLYTIATADAQDLPHYKIVTASERGTYIVLGRDLAKYVAPDARLELDAVPSAGSVENVTRLRYEPGVKLAIVQADVWQAYLTMATENKEAATLIRPLRVVLPLYFEEIQFMVRADSPLTYIDDIKGQRISAGQQGSGVALTTATLYRAMFNQELPRTAVFQSNEDALVALLTKKDVDVVALIGGQPMKLIADMKPEAKDLIKFLRFDPKKDSAAAALRIYSPATIRQSSYPNLLDGDVPTLAVRALLVTYDFNLKGAGADLVRLSRALCTDFATLRDKGHPKWKDVELGTPELGEGWQYYGPTAAVLGNCRTTTTTTGYRCTAEVRALGLCK